MNDAGTPKDLSKVIADFENIANDALAMCPAGAEAPSLLAGKDGPLFRATLARGHSREAAAWVASCGEHFDQLMAKLLESI